jgi:2-phosphosulfolactate phosphatase
MPQHLNVYCLPTLVAPEQLAGGTVVVIDVLRASTTIIYALEAGAVEVIPCLEVEEALKISAGLPRSQVVLGGERGGLRIEGFDLGNSPLEFDPASVGGKTLVFTTTNGTRAMNQCRLAERVLIGAFVNAAAVVEQLAESPPIHLVCAGSGGDITRDDVLFAGLLVDRLQRRSATPWQLNAQAITARENWLASFAVPMAIGAERLPPPLLADQLRKSLAGQRLVSIGLEDDLYAAAQLDRFAVVPVLDTKSFRIRLCGG